jgi:hypothetical protein
VLEVRDAANLALEKARGAKLVGASTEAKVGGWRCKVLPGWLAGLVLGVLFGGSGLPGE